MERTYLKRKAVDDVLGGEDSWKNVDSTEVECPKECGSERAFFMQIQIRSADEPSTTFYKYVVFFAALFCVRVILMVSSFPTLCDRCCNMQCNHQWREN